MGFLPIIIGSVAAVVLYLVWQRFGNAGAGVPKSIETSVVLFTRRHSALVTEAANHGGLLLTKRAGGYAEMPNTDHQIRSGRVWKRWGTPEQTDAARSRRTVYLLREDDVSPLDLSAGVAAGYVGRRLTHEQFTGLKDLNARASATMGVKEGSARDHLGRMFGIVMVLAVGGGVLAWGALIVAGILTGVKVI